MAMLPRPQVVVTATGPIGDSRIHGQAKRVALRQGAAQWQKFLPRHTAPGAATKYGYVRRKESYIARMRALGYRWRPDYLSGVLAESLRHDTEVRPGTQSKGILFIRAKLGGVDPTSRINVTSKFRTSAGPEFLTDQQQQIIRRRAEITATTPGERDQIAGAVGAGYIKYISSTNRQRVKLR